MTDPYPRSKMLRSVIDKCRMQALAEILFNRDFEKTEDWPKVKKRGRYLARQELDDLVSRQVERIKGNQ